MPKSKPIITVQFNVKLDPKLNASIDRAIKKRGVTKAKFADEAFRAHLEKEPTNAK